MASTTGTTSTSSAAGAAGAGVGAGVGSTSTGSQTSSTSSTTSTSGKGSSGKGSSGSGLTFTGLTFSDGKFSAPGGKGTNGNSTTGNSIKGITLGSVGTGLGLDGSIGEGIGLTTQSNTSTTAEPTKAEPVMTVDEVYGKGNQSIVENQGDYEAASNEKSNVETQTFGKQDEISFTPLSITENKGEVENDAIGLFEGLDFQQKDKAAQEVMDAKKARDEAEAEDKSDKAREQLAANESEENEENAFDFKIGERDEEIANADKNVKDAQAEVDNLKAIQENNKISKYLENEDGIKEISLAKDMLDKTFEEVKQDEAELAKAEAKAKAVPFSAKLKVMVNRAKAELQAKKEEINNAVNMFMEKFGEDSVKNLMNAESVESFISKEQSKISDLNKSLDEAQSKLSVSKKAYNDLVESKYVSAKSDKTKESISGIVDTPLAEPAPTNKSNAEVSFESARNEINNANIAEETKSKAIETVNNVEAVTKSVNDAADALAANPNDPATIEAYVNAVKTYNENVENALKGNPLAKTDFNKAFTEMVAKSNDFDITMPDGTKVSYAEFAAEKAVESPALAKGLYEAKAKTLADEGHTVLAAIENAKAKMVTTWLGSKFTFADNQVRSQFNQMAKTDMRATYATYNNVLSDPNATPEQRADAEAQIAQAKSLMTASAALQASTGFLSGIGDSMKDGVYGVTDPNALTVSQKTMNTISNFAKVVLGLGVTPGANKAYQNMYYLAADKVNKSNLFGKDFDGDGFALCQEYGNNAAADMIAGVGELATGIALFFNPATASMGLNLAVDSLQTFLDGLYGVQREAQKSVKYSSEIVSYLREAKDIVSDAGTEKEKTVSTAGVTIDRVIDSAISQIENFELKSDEANNLDNWLEGSGSNTTDNEKFNQSLTYDEWLKLIEADPTMQEYAKKLIAEKK